MQITHGLHPALSGDIVCCSTSPPGLYSGRRRRRARAARLPPSRGGGPPCCSLAPAQRGGRVCRPAVSSSRMGRLLRTPRVHAAGVSGGCRLVTRIICRARSRRHTRGDLGKATASFPRVPVCLQEPSAALGAAAGGRGRRILAVRLGRLRAGVSLNLENRPRCRGSPAVRPRGCARKLRSSRHPWPSGSVSRFVVGGRVPGRSRRALRAYRSAVAGSPSWWGADAARRRLPAPATRCFPATAAGPAPSRFTRAAWVGGAPGRSGHRHLLPSSRRHGWPAVGFAALRAAGVVAFREIAVLPLSVLWAFAWLLCSAIGAVRPAGPTRPHLSWLRSLGRRAGHPAGRARVHP